MSMSVGVDVGRFESNSVCALVRTILHHLLLQAAGLLLALHRVLVCVLNIRQAERTTAVLVAGELGDGRLGVRLGTEFDNASAGRALVGLVLDLCTLNLADRREQLNQVLVARAPRQLCSVS